MTSFRRTFKDPTVTIAQKIGFRIEFVKFIFAHEDIQKALLTKTSVEVFLTPKSKEIRARKHRADIIKRQLGAFRGPSPSDRMSLSPSSTTTNDVFIPPKSMSRRSSPAASKRISTENHKKDEELKYESFLGSPQMRSSDSECDESSESSDREIASQFAMSPISSPLLVSSRILDGSRQIAMKPSPIQQQQQQQHWTDAITVQQSEDAKEFAVHLSVSKELGLVIDCPTMCTSNEFRAKLIERLESMVVALKVGTLAIDNGASNPTPLTGNSVIHNFLSTSTTLPTITVLKPGMHEILSTAAATNNLANSTDSMTSPVASPPSTNLITAINRNLRPPRDVRLASFSLGEQRDVTVKATLQRRKLAQIQIGSLLGKPPQWSSSGNNETRHFCSAMERAFDLAAFDSRDRVKVTMARVSKVSADPLLPSTFRIRVYLPPDNHSTTVSASGEDTLSTIIERVIAKHNATKLLTDQRATDFVVRITGTSDHVMRDCPVLALDAVRARLQRNKDIKLTLVHRSSLPSTHIDGYSEPIGSPMVSSSTTTAASAVATASTSAPRKQGSFLQHRPGTAAITKQQHQRSILLYEINRPFEIRIICLENLNAQALFSHFLPDTSPNDIKLSVNVGLLHGEELLAPQLDSLVKPTGNPLWCEWLRSTLLMCDIPRATRLRFTLFAVTDRSRVAIGWVEMQLIDYRGQLQSGVISLVLWPGDRTSNSDFKPMCPSLVIELLQFPFPVLFPKPELMEKTEIKDYVEARKQDEERLQELINKDPISFPHSLSKVLQSLHWNNPQETKEAHRLLSIWAPLTPEDALELLDVKFADELVREYAVNCLRSLTDTELTLYLLQLVQSLKHEPYHDSALARFLISRALNSRAVIGHAFFWHLSAESANLRISDRYLLVLETYLRGCGDERHELVKQMEVVTKLAAIARLVKETPATRRKQILHDELSRVSWPNTFHLPTSASSEACGIIVSECKWLDSFTTPLWLVFQNVDPAGDPIVVIYKHGDDLRQDILTLQMISLMDNLWKRDGLDLHMSIYNVTATGDGMGFIEVVNDSDTVANIQKAAGGVTAAFTKTPLANWLRERNPTEAEYEFAVQNFIHSLSGYCVATYILAITLLTLNYYLDIDFAHFLGNIMKFHMYKRETAPFVLTTEFAFVMGGEKSPSFKWFTDLCCLSYNIIRKQRNLFIILFNLMLSTGIPELSTRSDIDYLREAFLMDLNDDEAKLSFSKLIQKSLKTKTTQVMFAMHILAHPDKNQ
eukprot:gene7425-8686_t